MARLISPTRVAEEDITRSVNVRPCRVPEREEAEDGRAELRRRLVRGAPGTFARIREPLTEKLGQEGWELAGKVGVHLGCVIIGDPIMTQDFDWTTSLAVMTMDYAEVEAGVVVAAGWGDGTYPVYVRRSEGRVSEVRVVFIAK